MAIKMTIAEEYMVEKINEISLDQRGLVKKTKRIIADTNKNKRLRAGLCKICFNIGAIRQKEHLRKRCLVCNRDFSNKTHNEICPRCCYSVGLCIVCGAEMNYKKVKKINTLPSTSWEPDVKKRQDMENEMEKQNEVEG